MRQIDMRAKYAVALVLILCLIIPWVLVWLGLQALANRAAEMAANATFLFGELADFGRKIYRALVRWVYST